MYVCSYNKWNPYSEEIKMIPDFYWIIQYNMIYLELKRDWDNFYKPQAELIGQISNPEVFKYYYDQMKQIEKQKKEGKDKGEISYTSDGTKTTIAEANGHYDPQKGLIDNKGNVIVSKEDYNRILGLDGVMASY